MLTHYMYQEKRERGIRLASIEDSVKSSIQRLEDCTEKHEGKLITACRHYTDTASNKQHLTQENLDVDKKKKL